VVKLLGVGLPPDLPDAKARIPVVAIRATFVIAGALLCLVVYGLSGWLVVGIVLIVAAVVAPRYLLGWGLIMFLAAGQLAHRAALSWRFMVLLAGLHLLHILAMWVLELPWRSWVQPGVFRAPLLRFIMTQIPIQLLAVLSLALLAPHSNGHRPLTVAGLAVVGAVALAGLALRLTGPQRDKD
jgi:hypothetical protein